MAMKWYVVQAYSGYENKVREALSLDGVMSDEAAKTALKSLVSFDPAIKADKIDLSRTYTNQFARKAKEKFKA